MGSYVRGPKVFMDNMWLNMRRFYKGDMGIDICERFEPGRLNVLFCP